MVDVARWLAGLGLERYAELFAANDIDASLLRTLADGDLKDLGISSLGHRRRLLQAIASLDPGGAEAGLASSGDRRHLTIMFVDLVGSTELSVRLDPEEMREVLRAYRSAVAAEVERFEGYIAKLMGDGLLVYFGWPRMHEHEAERAARAGLAIVAAVSRLVTPAQDRIEARVGIASGMVMVGEVIGAGSAREATVVGEAPSLAARLQTAAPAGGVLIADSTRLLLAGQFELAPQEELAVKGFAEPTPAWRVIGEAAQATRFAARAGAGPAAMAGRDAELNELLGAWDGTRAGRGQAILLEGEAGIGKSRLVHELRAAIAGGSQTEAFWQCSPFHGETPLWPVFRELLGNERPATLDRLEQALKQKDVHTAPVLPLVTRLLGLQARDSASPPELSVEGQRTQLLTLLVDRLAAIAARQPLLLVIEDLHWADATTVDLLRLLLGRIHGLSALAIISSRPNGMPDMARSPQLGHLRLGRLDRTAIARIVAAHASQAQIAAGLSDIVCRQADGVPLFAEELAKSLVEQGWATETAVVEVPASLHDTLMARLDHLEGAKEVAQVAACIGREFDQSLLAAIADRPKRVLRRCLDRLCAAGILIRHGATPDVGYSFRQALVRDAAYESLLRTRRREVHARLYAEIERRGGPGAAERAAHHAAAAELWAGALHYYGAAGRAGIEHGATAEGLALIDKALAAGHRLGADLTAQLAMIELRRTRSWACLAIGDTPRVMADLRDAEANAGRLGMKRLSCQLRAQRAYVEAVFGGHAWRAARYARDATRIAATVADRELASVARFVLGQCLRNAGDHRAAVAELQVDADAYRHGLRIAAVGSRGTLAVEGLAVLGDCLGQLGRWDEAVARGSEARAVAEETGLPWDRHVAGYHLARTLLAQGNTAAAMPLVEEGLAVGRACGLAAVTTQHRALLASANTLAGRPRAALELLEDAIAGCIAMRLQWAHCFAMLLRAEACAALGSDDAQTAAEALELARTHGYRALEATALRLVASSLLPRDVAGARERLRSAEEIATALALAPERMAIAELTAHMGPPME